MTNDWDSDAAAPDGAPRNRVLETERRRTVRDEAVAMSSTPHAETICARPVPARATLTGGLRERLTSAVAAGLLAFDVDALTAPFSCSRDAGGGFRGEFWGKWALAALSALRTGTYPELATRLEQSVDAICATADSSGYVGTYPADQRLSVFDIWNTKYTAWALLEFGRELARDRPTRIALRALKNLRDELGARGQTLEETGIDVLRGAGSLSLLSVLAGYADVDEDLAQFAREAVSSSRADTDRGIIAAIESGAPPSQWPSAKAYELMSVLEGLGRLARFDDDRSTVSGVVAAAERILEREVTVIGSCSSQELFADTARSQTRPLPQPHETCVTVYWMRLSRLALELTGDARWAEALEISLHNALLAATTPDGSWWSYFTPLEGSAEPSPRQFGEIPASCCVLNGYRGLFDVASWIVDEIDTVVRLNSFVDGSYVGRSGAHVDVSGDFAASGRATVRLNTGGDYTLRVRRPSWAPDIEIDTNAKATVRADHAGWLDISAAWQPGDILHVRTRVGVRYVSSPTDANVVAVMRGPFVMAQDAAGREPSGRFTWFTPGAAASLHVDDDTEDASVDMPIENRPAHYFEWQSGWMRMIPFAQAASSSLVSGVPYRVWFPQPWVDDLAGEAGARD